MVFGSALMNLGVVALLVPVFAEYAKIRKKAQRAFSLIAGSGVLFVLAAAFKVSFGGIPLMGIVASGGAMLFQFIGWIFALIGAIWAAYKIAAE